jgi:hypothetical protein
VQLADAIAEELSTYDDDKYPSFIPASHGRPAAVAFGRDTKSLASSILYRHCQGVTHLAKLADRVCRKWEKGPPIQAEGRYVRKKSASRPEIAVVVGAIYTIWVGHLGKKLLIGKSLSPKFIDFAKRVFQLNGEDIEDSALRKRLKDQSYKMFILDEVRRKIDELNSR